MTTATLTLADFLLARIAEDEQAAHSVDNWDDHLAYEVDGFSANAQRFIRHMGGPARVLAECEAKRRIVERHSSCDDVSYGDDSTCPELCALAEVYADHPDYRDEWRP